MQVESAESEEELEEEEGVGEGEAGGVATSEAAVQPKKLTGPVKRKRVDASLGEKSGK